MPSFGSLSQFDPTKESWDFWYNNFLLFAESNTVHQDRMLSTLLTMAGPNVLKLATTLVHPRNVREFSATDMAKVLLGHFQPATPVIMDSVRFLRRNQQANEPAAVYLADLRRLAIRCNYEAEMLERNLRDKFVSGLRDEKAMQRLLTEKDLNVSKALELVQALEIASANSTEIRAGNAASSASVVSKVSAHGAPVQHGSKHQHRGQRKPQQQHSLQNDSTVKPCMRCGKFNHTSDRCRFINATCSFCSKKGHLEVVCMSKQRQAASASHHSGKSSQRTHKSRQSKLHFVDGDNVCDNPPESRECHDGDILTVSAVNQASEQPIKVPATINGEAVQFELDCGASVSLVSKQVWQDILNQPSLRPFETVLKVYGGQVLPVLGQCDVLVRANNRSATLPLVVVSWPGASLLGRNWFAALGIQFPEGASPAVNQVQGVNPQNDPTLAQILERHSAVFRNELGDCKGVEARLIVKPDAIPKFCKPWPVPFALRPKVEEELLRLQKEGIISKVQFSKWAAPLVVVPKAAGSVRLCGNYKLTINPHLDVHQYPLPRCEELLALLNGGEKFSQIDLKDAYLQIRLAEESKEYLCVNTHPGLFAYNRMPFGIAPAAAIFQQAIEQVLAGVQAVAKFQDDLAVTGKNDSEHYANLDKVLSRLAQHGLRVKLEKCKFMVPSITFLGHQIDKRGIHTSAPKVEAVLKIKEPENVSQVKSFLGVINYYARFVPRLADIAEPLNSLQRDDRQWRWTGKEQQAFESLKLAMSTAPVLAHYSETTPLGLACDASSIGLGCVLFHRYNDSSERPIAYASKTLTGAESRYSQIDKEALSLVFGVRKFHVYLYGRRFVLQTDHKPLLALFGEHKGIPTVANNRLQRWAIILSAYSYDLEFRPTSKHLNADTFSRHPVGSDPHFEQNESLPSVINEITEASFAKLPLQAAELQKATAADSTLQQVLQYIVNGWPLSANTVAPATKPYFYRRSELSVYNDCIVLANRVVIPATLQPAILAELHSAHAGIVRMKGSARQLFWWPGIDSAIENYSASCNTCKTTANNPPKAPVHHWPAASGPWQRINIDFAGPYLGKSWLIVVDSYSKFPEVVPMTTTTSETTINALLPIFGRFGLPLESISDNGPQLVSAEFQEFCSQRGIRHSVTAPYFPQTNGAAERFVQSFKMAMDKAQLEQQDKHPFLHNIMLRYRSSIHPATGKTPAELLFGRPLRTKLHLWHPAELNAKPLQPAAESAEKPTRSFSNGSNVWIRSYAPGKGKWIPAVIESKLSPVSYNVRLPENQVTKRHIDQIRKRENRRLVVPAAKPSTQKAPPAAAAAAAASNAPEKPTTPPQKQYPLRSRATSTMPSKVLLVNCVIIAALALFGSSTDAAVQPETVSTAAATAAVIPTTTSEAYSPEERLADYRAQLAESPDPKRKKALERAIQYLEGLIAAEREPPTSTAAVPKTTQPTAATTSTTTATTTSIVTTTLSVVTTAATRKVPILPTTANSIPVSRQKQPATPNETSSTTSPKLPDPPDGCRAIYYTSLAIICLLFILIVLVISHFRASTCFQACGYTFTINVHRNNRAPAPISQRSPSQQQPVNMPLLQLRY